MKRSTISINRRRVHTRKRRRQGKAADAQQEHAEEMQEQAAASAITSHRVAAETQSGADM